MFENFSYASLIPAMRATYLGKMLFLYLMTTTLIGEECKLRSSSFDMRDPHDINKIKATIFRDVTSCSLQYSY
jgi:hypothetical protein